jgi:1-acyl-sn-glycerol-3-phosphate acyltransferase
MGSYVTPTAREAVTTAVSSVRAPLSEWTELHAHLQIVGSEFGRWTRNDLAARLTCAFMIPLMIDHSAIDGFEHLDSALALAEGRRLMLFGNHLSYVDITALTALLDGAGRSDFARSITVVSGPKVYTAPLLRLASAGMHSIKVAQSASVASGGAQIAPRDVVRIAKHCLGEAAGAMDEGHAVLIYPEGTRSRSRRLGPFLRATNRWLTLPGVIALPIAVWGTDRLYEIDDDLLHPAECRARFGPPFDVDSLRADGVDRDGVLVAARTALAELLPEPYQPDPGVAPIALPGARP